MNRLYFGDNLEILRQHVPDESVDLIYLDPPFNSNKNYNVLFQTPKGEPSQAQIEAFRDSWQWSLSSAKDFDDILQSPHTNLKDMMKVWRNVLGESNLLAYLVMMANRLVELHRVLKPTGSLYLHCDESASHYLKTILDAIFGVENFRNHLIWERTKGRSHTNKKPKRWGRNADHILYYARSEETPLQLLYVENNPEYIKKHFIHQDPDGRVYRIDNLASPSKRPNLMYEYKGYPPPAKGWAVSYEVMQQMEAEGRLHFPTSPDGRIQRKRYLDELRGETIQSIWDDIPPVTAFSKEGLGYPTQKPLALLERIILASSKPGDVVLDPFCGCGTAVHAAEALERRWIGIDISHLAITLIEHRLRSAFAEIEFEVEGSPKDLAGAQDLFKRDPFQFEWWACSLVGAQPANKQKKGADKGLDGVAYFSIEQNSKMVTEKVVVSIKGGQNVGVQQVRELIAVMKQNEAALGLFVTLHEPTQPMLKEALAEGLYTTEKGEQFPRVQILTIAQLMGQKLRLYPDRSLGEATFKKSPRQQKQGSQQKPLI